MARTTNAPLVDSYDFSRFGTVADVGGSNGSLLAAILRRCREAAAPGTVLMLIEQVLPEHLESGVAAQRLARLDPSGAAR